jgi:Zn-dependent protease with chaperone function
MSSAPTLDIERQVKAKEYARVRRRLLLVDLGLSGVITLAWLIFGWAGALRGWLLTLTASQSDWRVVAAFGAIFYLSFVVLELPLEYYAGFVLPHRYDQSTETLGGWVKDQLLGLLLTAVIGLPLLEGLYWLLRATGPLWWVWAAAGYVLLAVVFANLAPVVILPLFNKYVPLGEEHAELAARLTALAQRAGTKVNGVFRFDLSKRTRSANAALTGLGNTRRIILGDTLLDEFTADEVETVIAHELGHHVHRDILLGLLASAALSTASLYLASLALSWGTAILGFSGPADVAALPLFALTLGVFGLVTLPLNNTYSRWREARADRYALEATRNPQAFANAMTRLANQNLADADPEPWVVFLMYSHPPIRDRVAMAAKFQAP